MRIYLVKLAHAQVVINCQYTRLSWGVWPEFLANLLSSYWCLEKNIVGLIITPRLG